MRRRSLCPTILVLTFVLCLAGLSEGTLFAAPPPPPPAVQARFDQGVPDVPPLVLVGENFTFRVRLKNTGGSIGFGPFIDLVLDAGGANLAKPCPCDGMTFVSATMIGVNGAGLPVVPSVNAAPCASSGPVSLTHPFAASGIQPVTVPAGSQLVTLTLPFGSFGPSQPEVIVEVTAHVSNLADVIPSHPFVIYARGGFRYGADQNDNPGTDCPIVSDSNSTTTPPCNNQVTVATLWNAQALTTPVVMIVTKAYLGPENETATGPNFLQRYQINVDIAAGQTINNLKVTDHLPNTMAFHHLVSASPGCLATTSPVPDVAHNGAANDLVLQCASITGVAGTDVTVIFDFFIPLNDANGNPVLADSCAPVPVVNAALAEGDWTSPDPCDVHPQHLVINMLQAPPLLAKCLAIQKSVAPFTDLAAPGPTPGDTLQYTLKFELSDFRTAGSLKIRDIFSDGQSLVPGSLTFAVVDQCGTTSGTLSTAVTTLSCLAPGTLTPLNQLAIDLSAAMFSAATDAGGPQRHKSGILTGGLSFAVPSGIGATGIITFRTKIDDAYHCPVAATHDVYVDKDDPLTNSVVMTASTLINGGSCATIPVGGFIPNSAQDDSGTLTVIVGDSLVKTVYAVRRGNVEICGPHTAPFSCPAKPDVVPGDDVTFRLMKTIPSTDAEKLTIQDFLPLPTFLSAGGVFTYQPCLSVVTSGLPDNGKGCFGPANTLTTPYIDGALPAYSGDGISNSIKFDYGSFHDPDHHVSTSDLLFTREVGNTPAADGLFTTNEAVECESNTFGGSFCQTAVAEVHVREPFLQITKGVIASDNVNAVFTPALGAVPNANASLCPRFPTGTIISSGSAINSVVSNVDAYDHVTFAIVVENTGGSAAYDIKLHDLFGPSNGPGCFVPDFTSLCVTNGTAAHTAIPFTHTPAGTGTESISLLTPLPATTTTPDGSNVAVITFQATIASDIAPGCCTNTAGLDSYSASPGGDGFSGPNFVTAGLGGAPDAGQFCVLPGATKSITSTSESFTSGTQVAVGEIIRYHLEVVVPEGAAASYQVQDVLPPGLSYLPNTQGVTISAGVTAVHPSPAGTGGAVCGGTGSNVVTFDFGSVTNTNNNLNQELIVLEFNALVCNVGSNHNGTPLDNYFKVIVGSQTVQSNTFTMVVAEPVISITKVASISPLVVGATASYTITIKNTGPVTAFNLQLTDQLPPCLANLTGVTTSPAAIISNTASALTVTITSIPVNGTVTVHYSATVNCVTCSQLINTATVTWTSLPGPNGTTSNPTGSSTPGGTGDLNGERNGTGLVNSYSASATAGLCCMQVSANQGTCSPNDGSYAYTFSVTNLTGEPVAAVTFSPMTPNVTMTPSGFITLSSLLASGASTTLTETIGGPGAVAGSTVCFAVSLGYLPYLCSTTQCVTLQKCCTAPPSGMVAWYPLDEGGPNPTLVADISGNGHNGTAHPAVNPSHTPVVTPAAVVGGSQYFVTGNFYVQVPDTPPLALDIGSGDFTIDAWVFSYDHAPIIDKFDVTTNTGYKLYLGTPSSNAGQTLYFSYGDGSGTTYTASASVPVPYVSWHHVAVTLQRGTSPNVRVLFYMDGVQQGSQSITVPVGNIANTLDLFIGGSHPIDTASHETAIDELEIFKRLLSPSEIQSIVNAGSFGKCKTQICVVKFNDLDHDGMQGPNEPLLSGWTFNVTDQNGVLVGTISSNSTRQSCLSVPPGTYTVTEQLLPGWQSTTPNPRTATVLAGQGVYLSFGNRPPGFRSRAVRP